MIKDYVFKISWTKTDIAIAVDKLSKNNSTIPLTTFYFWPREDGWKLLKSDLEHKPWLSSEMRFDILNGYSFIVKWWLQNVNESQEVDTFISPKLENVKVKVLGNINR